MPSRLNLGIVAAISILLITEALQAQTRPTRAIGYSAAERARVDNLLRQTTEQRDAHADRIGLSRRLMRSLARAVALDNPNFSDREFFSAVEAMAERAVILETENREMSVELSKIRASAIRDEAQALLTRAQVALEQGELQVAERLYRDLRQIRWEESADAKEAYNAALDLEISAVELQLDFDRARDMRLAASREELGKAEANVRRAFSLAHSASTAKHDEGIRFGRRQALENAREILQTEALAIVPRQSYPQLWSTAQNNLGITLSAIASRSFGDERLNLMRQATVAFQNSLEELSADIDPHEWAVTQNNLGEALSNEGIELGGLTGRRLLASAIESHRSALQALDRSAYPASWGNAKRALGTTLRRLGESTGGTYRCDLLLEAVQAFREALEIQSNESLDLEWGNTQITLGNTLVGLSESNCGSRSIDAAGGATDAFRAALTVFERDRSPGLWVLAKLNLSAALHSQARRGALQEKRQLYSAAIFAYREVLGTQVLIDQPFRWAVTQMNLGTALEDLAQFEQGEEQISSWQQAEVAYSAALAIFDTEDGKENRSQRAERAARSIARIQANIGR